MNESERLAKQHHELTRRYFLGLAAAGVTSTVWGQTSQRANVPLGQPIGLPDEAVAKLEYLTREENFKLYGRGNPPPHTLPPEKLREVGLAKETWRLEVVPDPESNAKVENPLSEELGTALDWDALMRLAETRAVRFLQMMSCTNGKSPCGMGLWEGVPLRDVLWLARPASNVRRVFYYGYHNDDPEQRFQSSLPIGRVLEDPPGEQPVLLCYKLNDKWLSPKEGGPVRMLVPDAYGNKSVKWLQRILLTNEFQANDTYAGWNNDTVSHVKTCARFLQTPKKVKAGEPIPITGVAQVGMSGLREVQYWIHPKNEPLPDDDPHFTTAPWLEAEILPPPESDWGGGLPDGKLPPVPGQIDAGTGRPVSWPLRGTLAHWAVLADGLAPGAYDLRCRTIDAAGVAQPMPRPFPKSGNVNIEQVLLEVEQ